ncbi:striatin-3-like isoform X2 [Anneissia japonica]|uniref:striatin-3-like isoform X2 n=1 Tax=Anneissia japonica TaxID=1529436 RepID=UPI0014258C22|nr:striatin-3-like isoform X2 [Anneissia japonica]
MIRMENGAGSSPQQLNQLNAGSNANVNALGGKLEDDNSRSKYTIPGILHFIQHEWARFEMERAQWEVERAELQARIAFLQGERKGQENLKHDLVRRIKMLEYALKQERAKFHKLKFGTDPSGELKPPTFEGDDMSEEDSIMSPNAQVNFKQGRQLLRQYLQEIGYTDTILDVRSNRVRSLLGLQSGEQNSNNLEGDVSPMEPLVNGESPAKPNRSDPNAIKRQDKRIPGQLPEGVLDNVLSSFEFLGSENVEEAENGDMEDGGTADDEADEREMGKTMGTIIKRNKPILGNESMVEDVVTDPDTEEALAEFDFLVSEGGEGAGEARTSGDDKKLDWGVDQGMISKLKEDYKKARKGKKPVVRPKRSALQAMLENLGREENIPPPPRGKPIQDVDIPESAAQGAFPARRPMVGIGEDEAIETALGLGDLAKLTVSNEADALASYDVSAATKDTFRKTWNPKYTLRNHFDAVRTLAFHPIEPVLITGSEDHSLKLWNLDKTVPAKKTASLDVEPIYTFRGHKAAVLCLAVSSDGSKCFSGSMDSTICCWGMPDINMDPYDSYDSSILKEPLVAHTNAVWDVAFDATKNHLVSASADGTVRLWNPQLKSPLLNTYIGESAYGVPTSVDFVRCDPCQVIVGYKSSDAVIYDLETATPIITLESKLTSECDGSTQINCAISHPTLPITITAHEDRHIRFFDNNTGKMEHSMVAHLDAVTSLAIDPNGLYLLSGSHDCSIRLWNLESKTCVQEITSHRKKFDEAIYSVAFHPSKPYIASGGADALAKVFV